MSDATQEFLPDEVVAALAELRGQLPEALIVALAKIIALSYKVGFEAGVTARRRDDHTTVYKNGLADGAAQARAHVEYVINWSWPPPKLEPDAYTAGWWAAVEAILKGMHDPDTADKRLTNCLIGDKTCRVPSAPSHVHGSGCIHTYPDCGEPSAPSEGG